MDSMDQNDSCWDFLDYNFIEETTSSNFLWPPSTTNDYNHSGAGGGGLDIDFSSGGAVQQQQQHQQEEEEEKESKSSRRKRLRGESCSRLGTKACREKLRRERLNDRFQDLSSVLEPGRPVKTDKPAMIDDAIRVLHQLKSETEELKETNEKLTEEIKSLKAEKTELREEKLMLKADKEKMEQQLKAMAVSPSGFMPTYPAAYHTAGNKMPVYPGYGLMPMWQYLPPATTDTSRDHELRPPAA